MNATFVATIASVQYVVPGTSTVAGSFIGNITRKTKAAGLPTGA